MRAQQSAGQGGYGGAGSGNNGYGDHMYPSQQASGVGYQPPSAEPYADQGAAAYPNVGSAAVSQPQTTQTPSALSPAATSQVPATGGAYEMQSMSAQQPSAQGAGVAAPLGGTYGTGIATSSVADAYGAGAPPSQPAGGAAPGTTYPGSAAPASGAYGASGTNAGAFGATGTSAGAGKGAGAGAGAAGAGAAGAGAAGAGAAGAGAAGAGAGAGAGGAGAPAGVNMFFSSISEIQDTIRQIDQNVNRISELHSRSLNNIGEAAQQQAEQQLTQVAQETSHLTNAVKNKIKSLEVEASKIPEKGPAPEGVNKSVRMTQIGAAKNRFKETILRYQEVEKAYRVKYRQRTERQLRIVKPDASQAEVQAALNDEAGSQQIFSQALMNSNRHGEARGALREVQERNTDIKRIEQTITELAQLFQEMSILVEQQDEQLNVIQDHAQHTEQEVLSGRKQTDKAVISARRRRKRRIICTVLLVLIILIIIAAVVGGVCGHNCGGNGNNNNK